MSRFIRQSHLLTLLFAWAALSAAQQAGAPAHGTAVPPRENIVEVTLGHAAVPLYGPWKFTVGDSPIDSKTGQPLWAETGFDDSQWEIVDLTPKAGATDPLLGTSGYVPGWTARGHAGYWGYAWYRIQVRCQGGGGSALALAAPTDVDDAYQAFADGRLLGSFGNFSETPPVTFYSRPFQFTLPESCWQGPTKQTRSAQTLAFRFWMEPATLLTEPDSGGMHGAPLLGEASVIELHYQSQWLELIRGNLTEPVEAAAFSLLAIISFSLILFDRSDPVYHWIGLLFLVIAVLNGFEAASVLTRWIPIPLDFVVSGILIAVLYLLWGMVWWVWFGREAAFRWLPSVLAGFAVLYAASSILGQEAFARLVSHRQALRLYSLNQGLRFVFIGLLAWVVIDGIRRKGIDGWLVLPVVLLRGIANFSPDLVRLHLFHNWIPLGVQILPGDVADLLVAAVIALLLMRRLLLSVQRQREMALDVKQAQEMQQLILPERHITLQSFVIESEYRPAREVGGDFFQIIPHPEDGSILIVAGDVSGKGLRAGMLVALLVGAIRTEAQHESDPTDILNILNQRLIGRGNAQATCLAMRIEGDGRVTLANAGHIAPYLNAKPLAMDGALPLGIIEGAEPSMMDFQLEVGDKLMLLSDGVAEATDEDGKLFGFERVEDLLREAMSASEVAQAAQAFGQEDDVSVISVTRTTMANPAVA